MMMMMKDWSNNMVLVSTLILRVLYMRKRLMCYVSLKVSIFLLFKYEQWIQEKRSHIDLMDDFGKLVLELIQLFLICQTHLMLTCSPFFDVVGIKAETTYFDFFHFDSI